MAQKRSPAKKTSKNSAAKTGSNRMLGAARRTIRALPLTSISLGLNAVLLLTFFTLIGWTHVHSFWFAERLSHLHRAVCPNTVATGVEQKEQDGVMVATYTITDKALKSGCADGLLDSARLSDYLAHPDRAKADAAKFLQVSPKGLPTVTVVKSAETGQQLAPADN